MGVSESESESEAEVMDLEDDAEETEEDEAGGEEDQEALAALAREQIVVPYGTDDRQMNGEDHIERAAGGIMLTTGMDEFVGETVLKECVVTM